MYEDVSLPASPGAGELLTPGELAAFEAVESTLDILDMVTPNPPPEIENGLPEGSGYLFSRDTLRSLTDASGGRRRRFCAESSIRGLDGSQLTPSNAIRSGEMSYRAGGF